MVFKRLARTTGLVAVVSAVALVVGCSSGQPSEESGDVSLSFQIWDENQVTSWQSIADAFTEQHPDVSINVTSAPWPEYWVKMQTGAASKTLPDLFYMSPIPFFQYATAGALAEIGPGFDKEAMDQRAVNALSVDGKLYGATDIVTPTALWYNKDILDRAGVSYPTVNWTLEDFKSAALQVGEKLGAEGIYGTAAAPGWGQMTYYDTMIQEGGFVLSDDKKSSGFDEPGSIKGLQFWVDLVNAGAAPTVAQLDDINMEQMFEQGKLAMLPSGPWMAPRLKALSSASDYDLAPLPGPDLAVNSVAVYTAVVISAFTPSPKATQDFVAFLSTNEAQTMIGELGLGIPARVEASKAYLSAAPEYNLQALLDEVPRAVAYPSSLKTATWQDIENKYIAMALNGEISVEEAAAAIAKGMNEVLASEEW